jgi:hypothetical protein
MISIHELLARVRIDRLLDSSVGEGWLVPHRASEQQFLPTWTSPGRV